MIPGWPYSMIAALEEGSPSWTAPLDLLRLLPGQDATTAAAEQVGELVERWAAAGHHRPGDPDILVVLDAGYDPFRLAFLLADLPVEVLGRLRSDRVLCFPAPKRRPDATGRPAKHGAPFPLADSMTWPDPHMSTTAPTRRYGVATARAWDRLHPRLTHRSAWAGHEGPLPVIEGTLVFLEVEALPSRRAPQPLWLWSSTTGLAPGEVDRLWQAYLRRFDIEHTFRFLKQQLGWNAPRLREPAAADRWSWIVMAAYTQLRLARGAIREVRLPWQPPTPSGRMSPSRVRGGFGASTRACAEAPVLRNSPGRVPGTPRGVRTSVPLPATTFRRRTKRALQAALEPSKQVKQQARCCRVGGC